MTKKKSIFLLMALAFLFTASTLFARNRDEEKADDKESQGGNSVPAARINTRIGILDLDVLGTDNNLAKQSNDAVIAALTEIGAYDIYTYESLTAGYKQIDERMPSGCREPKCACEIGSTLQLDRVLYGNIDQNDRSYAAELTLVDVMTRQIIETTELEGDAGVSLKDVITVAVKTLHGQADENADSRIHKYFGPQVNNKKQFLISAPICLAGGFIFSIANGSLTKRDDNSSVAGVDFDYNYGSLKDDLENMYGVGAGANLIPLFGRPGALANAYVALSDDAYGVFFNPAGLGWLAGGEASLGYQYRFGLDNFAASYVNKATREFAFGQGFFHNSDREGLYYEAYFYSSVAYKVSKWIPFMRPIGFGANVRIISKSTGEASSPSASTGGGFGVGLDLGAQLELSGNIRGGILFRDVPSVIRYYNSATDTTYYEMEPVTFSWGGSFKAGYQTIMTCEVQTPLNEDQVWRFAGGIERSMFRVIRARVGIQKEADFDTPWKFTGGLGLNIPTEKLIGKFMIMDASYEYNTLTPFAHPVNLSFKFGF